jgi:hypothetical protein
LPCRPRSGAIWAWMPTHPGIVLDEANEFYTWRALAA